MKKLLSVFVALCFLGTAGVFMYAQDTPKKEDSKASKKGAKKKGGKKREDTPKKDGGK
jgi:hypothetical protein